MSLFWKRTLNIAGGALGLLGVVFVALRLYRYGGEADFSRFESADWAWLVGLCLIYGASNGLLARAWRELLFYFKTPVDNRKVARIYGLSQLAKYVPGNIFHLAGRQALGTTAGLPSGILLKSTLWELGLIAVAGGLFSPLLIPLLWEGVPSLLSVALFVGLLSGTLVLVRLLFSARVSRALFWHSVFFSVSGAIFVILLSVISSAGFAVTIWPALCGSYVVSWLAGFVTPGAPAGVGIREFVLLFLLKGLVVESDLLLVIVLGRMITILGDVLFFLSALFVGREKCITDRPC